MHHHEISDQNGAARHRSAYEKLSDGSDEQHQAGAEEKREAEEAQESVEEVARKRVEGMNAGMDVDGAEETQRAWESPGVGERWRMQAQASAKLVKVSVKGYSKDSSQKKKSDSLLPIHCGGDAEAPADADAAVGRGMPQTPTET